jgi:CIC family chloride channel protein
MLPLHVQIASHARLRVTRLLGRAGFGEHAILLPLSIVVGVLSAAAAVAFHESIGLVRDLLYVRAVPGNVLYGWGLPLLVLFPAAGGLIVGLVARYVVRGKEGHGVVDVIETVLRSRGRIRPVTAIEKILTSAVTIGSGGSAGAEGPIVQIGAAISSGVGQLFQVGKGQLPVLIGCGTAAGISAIFGSPIGGVLFTLEVILLDFSIRSFTPIAVGSVVAYVTTQTIFAQLHPGGAHAAAIFVVPATIAGEGPLRWEAVPSVVGLGLLCGLVGVTLTRAMHRSEELFRKTRLPAALRPALGGALLGLIGILYVVVFGWLLLGRDKPFDTLAYPMPAFFGDGYGVIKQFIRNDPTATFGRADLVLLLAFLLLAKIVGTCCTLSSGGSGGVIAPSLFLGATAGALLGVVLEPLGWTAGLPPGFYALIGMGAVLAAVVHAPLASILILMEVTDKRDVVLPAMLACVVATGVARIVSRDSIYTLGLRRRGVVVGSGADVSLLRRLTVDQVALEPVRTVSVTAPLDQLFAELADHEEDFVVVDADGRYAGLTLAEDIRTAMLQRDAAPHLLIEDLARPDLPTVKTTDDLAVVFEAFGRYDVARLAVCLASRPGRVVGLISRKELMRRYHDGLLGK